MRWKSGHSKTQRPRTVAARRSAPPSLLYSRNWAFIDAELQGRLARSTILTVGSGLGSVIVCLAARTGFQRFILADGDVVEESNLNRQAFIRGQIGVNKASATAALINSIAPAAEIRVVPEYVGKKGFGPLVEAADIVVNTIDMESMAFVELNRAARTAEKTVLFPINIGWGGGLLVFSPQSMSLDEFIDESRGNDVATRVVVGILDRLPQGLPPYLGELLPKYSARTDRSWPYDPQLGIASHITAALAVRTAVALVAGEPVRMAPNLIWCDTMANVAPDGTADGALVGVTSTKTGVPHGKF
jgi:molybdopterin-synthase adenylyltransferase